MHISILPVEILQSIFLYVHNNQSDSCVFSIVHEQDRGKGQGSEHHPVQQYINKHQQSFLGQSGENIKACARVCRSWHASVLRLLFQAPRLSQKNLLYRFIDTLASAQSARIRWIENASKPMTSISTLSQSTIEYPGNAVQELDLSLLTGSQSVITDLLLVRLISLLLWNPGTPKLLQSTLTPTPSTSTSRLKSLKMMDCFMVTASGLKSIFKILPPLSTFELIGASLDSQIAVASLLKQNAAQLERIALQFLFPHTVDLHLDGLAIRLCEFELCKPRIRMRHEHIENPDLSEFIETDDSDTYTGSTSLNSFHSAIPIKNHDTISIPLSYLQKLVLRSCSISDSCIQSIFKQNVHTFILRQIDLTGCIYLTDTAIKSIALACPILSRLSLERCLNITNESILTISKAPMTQTLSFLTLAACRFITVEGLKLLTHCSALRFLDLSKIMTPSSKQLLMLVGPNGGLQHVNTFKI